MKKLFYTLPFAIIILSVVLGQIFAADRPARDNIRDPGVVPTEGFVPNAKTAIRIAEAIIEPVYGLQVVRNEQPFRARLVDGEWLVKGASPTNADWRGGVVEVHVSKTNGCITYLFHGR